jgi:hypothetical protein
VGERVASSSLGNKGETETFDLMDYVAVLQGPFDTNPGAWRIWAGKLLVAKVDLIKKR